MGDKYVDNDRVCSQRLVTRAELLAAEVPLTTIESRLRSGRLHRVFDGVYAQGFPAISREEVWMAAVLACGPGAALSHLSAAVLWGFWLAEGPWPTVSAPRSRRGVDGVDVRRRSGSLATTEHRGLRVTTIAQTLLDLAATFTPANLERALGEAQLCLSFDAPALEDALRGNQRGVTKLRALWRVEHGAGVPRNLMERRFLALMRQANIRRPAVNEPWGGWEIDALWLPEGIAVELDGRTPHTRAAQFQRDRDKDADLQLAGLIALRYTWADLTRRPAKVTAGCCRAFALARARAWSAASRTR